jgi:hypothetical protein
MVSVERQLRGKLDRAIAGGGHRLLDDSLETLLFENPDGLLSRSAG